MLSIIICIFMLLHCACAGLFFVWVELLWLMLNVFSYIHLKRDPSPLTRVYIAQDTTVYTSFECVYVE